MVDWEEVKVDTGQVSYPHLLPIPVCRKSTSTLSKCPSSELPPPFSSMKCGEGDSILLATTNSTTPILRTMGVCVNRKSGLCIFTLTSVLFISVKPALLPCGFSLPKLASGVDNVQFGYVRKYELTVVVKSSRNGEKEARARRERLEYQRGTEEGALRVFDDIDRHVAILQLQSSFTEKPSRTAHTIPDSVHGIFQRADGLVLEARYLTAKALQQLRRLIELTSVCGVKIPKLFAVSWLYSGVEEASPSLSIKIEGAYIPINPLEEAWEESDGIMWDLAANQYPERLIGANWMLEVLLVGLGIISLGIIGNLVCHEALITQMISTRGLMETIIDQVSLAATPCLGKPCWFLTLGLQGSERVAWANALQSEHILNRTLGMAEHALNPQLVRESVGLLLAREEN